MNECLLEALNQSYVGCEVLDIYQVPGTIIVIDIGRECVLLKITIYMAYWAFTHSNDEVLTCFEPYTNREKYRNRLGLLKTKKLERIWFEDEELNLSFSGEFEFNVIEDLEVYKADRDVVRFSEYNKEKVLCYSPETKWSFHD